MKMTKSEFKLLMKECLTELINEGAFDKKIEQITEGKVSQAGKGMLFGNGHGSAPQSNQGVSPGGLNPKLLEAVRNVTSAQPSGRKGLFEEIMMDTALNTLQKQIGAGDGAFGGGGAGLYNDMPPDPVTQAQDQAELNALSGGNTSRWAVAAFGGRKK